MNKKLSLLSVLSKLAGSGYLVENSTAISVSKFRPSSFPSDCIQKEERESTGHSGTFGAHASGFEAKFLSSIAS